MFKKITITIAIIFAVILFYFAYIYFQVQNYKLVAIEKVDILKANANCFYNVGIIISLTTWLWVNIVVLKTRQLFWLFLPLLYTIIVAILIGYHEEDIFIFTKQNGLWKGSFSISYLISGIIIILAFIFYTIDYFVLKKVIKNLN